MLIFIRDASCTTQPLELLNSIGFENLEKKPILPRDAEVHIGDTIKVSDIAQLHNQESIDSSAVDTARNHYSSSLLDQDMDIRTDTDAEG